MIIGLIHKGSGLGDQLFSYIATRVRAADLGVDFGFVGKEYFKGTFMDLDWGKKVVKLYRVDEQSGALILDNPTGLYVLNKPYYDPEFNFIPDGSIIDGYGAQDIRYFEHRLDEVREWLKVEPVEHNDNVCVLNIRGGEYRAVSDLILPLEDYWYKGLGMVNDHGKKELYYEIHTDDRDYCRQLFSDAFPIYSDINLNWRSLRYAKNAIISNSAFAIIPRLLKHLEDPEAITIAPFGWNARNASLTEWKGRPGNYYPCFRYI